METLAEGVEAIEQFDVLKREGCHYIQGYMFAKPFGSESVLEWLASEAHVPRQVEGFSSL